jgi:hypothetical protein
MGYFATIEAENVMLGVVPEMTHLSRTQSDATCL